MILDMYWPDPDYVLGRCPDCGRMARLFQLVPGVCDLCAHCYAVVVWMAIRSKEEADADAAA